MKQRLTIFLALALLAACMLPAMAAMTEDGKVGETLVEFEVKSGFYITIPAGTVTINDTGVTQEISTTAGGTIDSTKKLVITATSKNPGTTETNKVFQVKNTNGDLIVYAVKKTDDTGAEIFSGDTVLEVTAAELNAAVQTQVLFFKLTGPQIYAGVYQDTITFDVKIV